MAVVQRWKRRTLEMAKRTYARRSVGTSVVVGGGTFAVGAWSPIAGAAVLGVAILLALTVAVVVLDGRPKLQPTHATELGGGARPAWST